MEFEQLLRKYLSGAISDAELEHFQTLLDRVPEYKLELRQTLEIRSLLHDDALNLAPPQDLSEHIRIAVGSSFAADAIAEREELVRQRRMFFSPFRVSASVLVAACMVAGVALSPTLPKRIAQGENVAALGMPEMPAPAFPAPAGVSSQGNGAAAQRLSSPQRADRTARATTLATVQDESTAELWMVGHEVPYRLNYTSPVSSEDPSSAIASNDIENGEGRGSNPSPSRVVLSHDLAEILNRSLSLPAYNPSIDSSTHRPIPDELLMEPKPGEAIATVGGDPRRLTIGVTLGSGQVAETKSPTALLQNSYYLSFSVSGSDRIGVEMGASAFQQEQQSADGLGKLSNGIGDDPNLGLMFGMVRPGVPGEAKDVPTGSPNSGSGSSSEFLTKKTIGAPSDNEQKVTARTPAATPLPPPESQKSTQRLEQQITYGAVFYDRRINLSKSWDLCGRVMVGGADNALMGNVRAYAAFTPGRKNITLTMGIGGAALYNLTSKGPSSSGNYGVYYGIETGF